MAFMHVSNWMIPWNLFDILVKELQSDHEPLV